MALGWPVGSGPPWPPPGWVVVGCDVGQGDAFVVASGPGSAVLVDVGPDPEPLERCLDDLGIERVDALVLTHFHADHVGGLAAVVARMPVTSAHVSPVAEPHGEALQVRSALETAGIPIHEATAGQAWTWGPPEQAVTAAVISPSAAWAAAGRPRITASSSEGGRANDASVVLAVRSRGLDLLLTGDIEPEAARRVRRALAGREFHVLKVAHHGSAAQDPGLITQTSPAVALIGVGSGNSFGHPTPTALDMLTDAGAVVLRTDLHGDVAVVVDDAGRLGVTHQRNPP